MCIDGDCQKGSEQETVNNLREVKNVMLLNKDVQNLVQDGKNSATPTVFHLNNKTSGQPVSVICFQDGPIKDFGVNGVQNEDVIVCLIERLKAFQSGNFPCRENAIAITKLEEALMWLTSRTLARIERGVEGKNEK